MGVFSFAHTGRERLELGLPALLSVLSKLRWLPSAFPATFAPVDETLLAIVEWSDVFLICACCATNPASAARHPLGALPRLAHHPIVRLTPHLSYPTRHLTPFPRHLDASSTPTTDHRHRPTTNDHRPLPLVLAGIWTGSTVWTKRADYSCYIHSQLPANPVCKLTARHLMYGVVRGSL